jgi:hypothetical protein
MESGNDKELTKADCVAFIEKELEWFKSSGYTHQPYAQKRLRHYHKIKSLLMEEIAPRERPEPGRSEEQEY